MMILDTLLHYLDTTSNNKQKCYNDQFLSEILIKMKQLSNVVDHRLHFNSAIQLFIK